MLPVKYFIIAAGLIGVAIATKDHASTVHLPTTCVWSTIDDADQTTKKHLGCNEDGAVKGHFGEMQYSCDPFDQTKNVEVDYILKKIEDGQPSILHSITLINKVEENKVYIVSSSLGEGKTRDYYYRLQGKTSCVLSDEDIEKIRYIVPTSFYVFDLKMTGGNHP